MEGMEPNAMAGMMQAIAGRNEAMEKAKSQLDNLVEKLNNEKALRDKMKEDWKEPEWSMSEKVNFLETIENPFYSDEDVIVLTSYLDDNVTGLELKVTYIPDKLRIIGKSFNKYAEEMIEDYIEYDLMISQMKHDLCGTLHPKYLSIECKGCIDHIAKLHSIMSSLVVYSIPDYVGVEQKKQFNFIKVE